MKKKTRGNRGTNNRSGARRLVFILIAVFLTGFAAGATTLWSAHNRLIDWRASINDVQPLTRKEISALRAHLNPVHLRAVSSVGIIRNSKEIDELIQRGELIHLSDCAYYAVHGIPNGMAYLRPQAERTLAGLGARFSSKLAGEGLPPARLCVTSALRTTAYQNQLQRRNKNAANHSAHEYGMAFDISYQRFPAAGPFWTPSVWKWKLIRLLLPSEPTAAAVAMKAVLGRLLLAVQQQKQALVIHESQQPCFHVTVPAK